MKLDYYIYLFDTVCVFTIIIILCVDNECFVVPMGSEQFLYVIELLSFLHSLVAPNPFECVSFTGDVILNVFLLFHTMKAYSDQAPKRAFKNTIKAQ